MNNYPITCPTCKQLIEDTKAANGHHRICKTSGKKYDSDKLRFDLIPSITLKALASVLTYGANKYGPNNWQTLENFEDRYTRALMHHLNSWRSGEKNDPESKLPQLWHMLGNVAFLIWKEENNLKKPHPCTDRNGELCSLKRCAHWGHCENDTFFSTEDHKTPKYGLGDGEPLAKLSFTADVANN